MQHAAKLVPIYIKLHSQIEVQISMIMHYKFTELHFYV